MGIAERRAREKDALKLRIVQAASELFVKEGFPSVSMRRIADMIEYAPSTIYLYFKNKDELLAEICRETFEGLVERLEAIDRLDLPPLEQFEHGTRCYIEFGLENPNHYQLVFCMPHDPEAAGMHDVNELGLQALGYLSRSIERCTAAQLLRSDDPARDSMVIWMHMHGVTSSLIFKTGKRKLPWPEKGAVVDRTVQLLLNSLR